jgi:hypothetical protein
MIASTHDLGKLVLSHFSQRWKLGSVVAGKSDCGGGAES